MRKSIVSLAMLAATAVGIDAAPLWLRNVAISPDGSTIAFTYKGNIFTVPSKGGDARQLTSGGSYNTAPVWSPDGSKISFGSDREGSMDVYVVNSKGGVPKRLTTNSGNETPLAFKDNNNILFSTAVLPSPIAAQGSFTRQVYSVDLDAHRPQMFMSLTIPSMSIGKNGKILYQDKKGVEDEWRKHERSSGTSDVWLLDNGKHTKLTDFNGHDLNPIWASDGSFYFVSEEDGTLNVYKRTIDGKQKKQLTSFTTHPVRSLSASTNGMLAFSWNGEIYTMNESGGKPSKVNVNIVTDDYVASAEKSLRRAGASSFVVSSDGELIAFILRGDVYITSTEYNTTRRITDTPAQERFVDFAPDGRSIVYDSDRDGIWQLFTAEIKDSEEKSLLYATEIVEKPLYKSDKPAFFPDYSPDGKSVAFLENRTTLRVLDLKSKKVKTILDGKYNYSYQDGDIGFEWSPDSKWLLIDYIGIGGWNNSDIALVKADGNEVINLTESGYSNGRPQWVLDGKAVAYTTGKYGYKSQGSWGNDSDILLMFLDGEAYDRFNMTEEEVKLAEKADKDKKEKEEKVNADKKDKDDKKGKKKDKKDDKDKADKQKEEVKPLSFELADRRHRIERLTGSSARIGSYYVSPKADKLYYVASSPDGRSLYERDLKKGDTKTLAFGLSPWGMIPDKDGKNIFIMDGSGIKKVNLASGKQTPVTFEAEYTRRAADERSYIYEHMWRQVLDKFYDENLHGVDWAKYHDEYAKFLPYINNNYDFAILLSEILGELNASHTGGGYRRGLSKGLSTSSLGAFFDESYKGDGLKIAEIIKRGPLSAKSLGVEVGDIILAINDSVILAKQDYFPLLEGKKKVKLDIKKRNGDKKTVYAKATNSGEIYELLYQRWVERNEQIVDSVSGGRIGYVHVKGMDGASYSETYDRLLGKYRNCDAVVVDTRHNGGGWLHNDLAILLSGKEYVRFSPRGQFISSEPFSQWKKPSVMLVDESNYSDAHGSPYVYQTLKIGDVVGAPVPGTMTAVWWETQIDPTLYFGIPQVTSLDIYGEPLENKQLNPDVLIYNTPENVLQGIDDQLIGATKHLMKKLAK